MTKGFYVLLAAQFLSALADNALLFAAIALLQDMQSPNWHKPLLLQFFVISYIVLAPFVGSFADALPKGRVMFISNGIKFFGSLAMLFGMPPLYAYGIVGIGAAAYSPAKYGILTELLPPSKLVSANGWMEGSTVIAIILGAIFGGHLASINTQMAIVVITSLYLVAAAFNTFIPKMPIEHEIKNKNPICMMIDFYKSFFTLWRDPQGQVSLAVTTLFWGAGATLQFIVIKWAQVALHMNLSQGAILQAISAVGVAGGAVWAASRIPLRNSLNVLPYGVVMGLVVCLLAIYNSDMLPNITILTVGKFELSLNLLPAYFLLILVGWLAGYFVVPMNALLQHRGHVLMSAGHSIAVQNFNENISVLTMLLVYSMLIWLDVPIQFVIIGFGVAVSAIMWLVIKRHARNQAEYDSMHLIGEHKH